MALTDSLIAWWDLEEDSGTRSDAHTDDSGGAQDLSDNNTVGSATGKVGTAAQFVASNNEFLSHPDDPAFSAGAGVSFTIAFWVYNTDNTTTQRYVTKWSNANEYIVWNESGEHRFIVSDSSDNTTVIQSGITPTLNGWDLVIVWHDASGDVVGLEINNGTDQTEAHSTDVRDGDSPFHVGTFSSGTQHLDGRMDSLAFWDRVLTQSERDELWNSGNGVNYSDISGGTSVTINTSLVSSTSNVHTPVVEEAEIINTSVVGSTTTIHSTTVTVASVTVNTSAVGSTSTVHTPEVRVRGVLDIIGRPAVTVTSGASDVISTPLVGSTSAVYTPTIEGPKVINISTVGSTSTVEGTQVSVTPVTVGLSAVGSTSTVHTPTVTETSITVNTSAVASTTTVYGTEIDSTSSIDTGVVGSTFDAKPTNVTVSPATVNTETVGSTSQVYSVDISELISVGLLDSSTAIHAAQITLTPTTVNLGTVTSASAIYVPTVAVASVIINADVIGTNSTVYDLSIKSPEKVTDTAVLAALTRDISVDAALVRITSVDTEHMPA